MTEQWQPIETAPKDEWIWACPAWNYLAMEVVQVAEDGFVWNGTGYVKPGFFTRWMPLPDPPK